MNNLPFDSSDKPPISTSIVDTTHVAFNPATKTRSFFSTTGSPEHISDIFAGEPVFNHAREYCPQSHTTVVTPVLNGLGNPGDSRRDILKNTKFEGISKTEFRSGDNFITRSSNSTSISVQKFGKFLLQNTTGKNIIAGNEIYWDIPENTTLQGRTPFLLKIYEPETGADVARSLVNGEQSSGDDADKTAFTNIGLVLEQFMSMGQGQGGMGTPSIKGLFFSIPQEGHGTMKKKVESLVNVLFESVQQISDSKKNRIIGRAQENIPKGEWGEFLIRAI